MLDYTELKPYFKALNLSDRPVIAHASLKPFGYIEGGADTVLQVMLESFKSLVMPTFTHRCMITPEVGPPNNGISYGAEKDLNKMAVSFKHDLSADPMMGIVPEALRNHPSATRTDHPILSFAGFNAEAALATQTLYDPLAPIGALADQDGWVVLINVDHSVNTSIHYAEKLAGRKQFIRWALVGDRVVECPNFPGDSTGFNALEEVIQYDVFRVDIGKTAFIQAVPLKVIIAAVQELLRKDPLALLCQRDHCGMCNEIRGIHAVG
jgi:aminoglycoside 3-N-acetyltransferase